MVSLNCDENEEPNKDGYINANYINCVNGLEKHIIAT